MNGKTLGHIYKHEYTSTDKPLTYQLVLLPVMKEKEYDESLSSSLQIHFHQCIILIIIFLNEDLSIHLQNL